MIFARSILTVLSLLLLASCGTNSSIERSRKYASLGDYLHAFEVLDTEYVAQLAAGEVKPELAAAHEKARREFLRDRAQMRIFQENEDAALRDLALLEAADPVYPGLIRLRKAAMRKKAQRVVDRADELLAEKEFAPAMAAYIESQRLVPGFDAANRGMERVREEMARLSARAQLQFLQAVRKVPEFRHIEVAWHAAAVIHLTPDATDEQRDNAQELRKTARHASAQETFKEAQECERIYKYGAALVLYKAARILDPDIDGADEAVAKMEKELRALSLLEKAQVAMRSDGFDEANALLAEAFELSTLSRSAINELKFEARKLSGQRDYRAARDLEVMGKKSEALAAFEALAAKWPKGIEDEAARIAGLRIDVEGAKAAWDEALKAEAAGDLAKAIEHFETAESYYAQWRDGEAHIERLRKLLAEQAAAEVGGDGGDSESGN